MIDILSYLLTTRWFQLLCLGLATLSAITAYQYWHQWRRHTQDQKLKTDLNEIYALELDAIRQHPFGNTEIHELMENVSIQTKAFSKYMRT